MLGGRIDYGDSSDQVMELHPDGAHPYWEIKKNLPMASKEIDIVTVVK